MGRWGERGYGGGGRGRFYTYRDADTTKMTPALRSAARHFNVSLTARDKVTSKLVSTGHNFLRERRAKADSNRGSSAYQPNALPLGQTSSLDGEGNSGSL